MLNIVSIIIIIFGYKYIKNNSFVPKIEKQLEKELKNFDISKYDWLNDRSDN